VSIVVDQFAGWIAEERLQFLPENGGFARLRGEGTWARDLRFAHAVTDTAPGHSALYTGLPPRETGIFANEVFDPESKKLVSILRDPKVALVAPEGTVEGSGVSLAILQTDTVADRVRAEHPQTAIVTISLKDRGAVFGGGRHPDAAIWYEPRAGGFATSTAFADSLPSFAPSNYQLAVAAETAWEPLDDAFLRAHAKTPDNQPGEGDASGIGLTFPHKPASNTALPLLALRYTPEADRLLLAAALAAIDKRDDRPMLLALSLSTFDYVGHVWGPDSWESWDELARLDAALGKFFSELDKRVGKNGWSLVLSADHGTTSMPEVAAGAHAWCKPNAPRDKLGRPCGPVTRVIPTALADELRAVAASAIGPGDWILGVADPYVYFTRNALALPVDKRAALERAIIGALEKRPEVAIVLHGGRRESCASGESLDALACRSFSATTREMIYVGLKPGSFFDAGHAVGRGSSHGSPYAFDRSVPFFVRAPGRAAAGATITETVSFESFARTLAALLGVSPLASTQSARNLAP